MPGRATTSLALLAGALACNGPAADTGFASSQPGPTSAPPDSSTGTSAASSSDAGDSTASSEDSGAGSTEPLRDLGGEPDFGPDKPLGCKGKIDFLFLISRFGNMQTEQQQLLASFPGFIDTIETMFPEFDTHIMVANPEGTWPGWGCETVPLQERRALLRRERQGLRLRPGLLRARHRLRRGPRRGPALQRGPLRHQHPVFAGRRPPLHHPR
jgi:hypothetical protein